MQWLIDIILERIMQRFSGVMQMWTGTIANIPEGALLCDGTNGTPDMRERFARGAPDLTEPGTTGGTEQHNHDVQGNTGLAGGPFQAATCSGKPVTGGSHCHYVDLVSSCSYHLPPFYEVLYIMWA